MDYIFTVRSIKGGSFSDEPGATHFLAVPEDRDDVRPEQKITKTQWFNAVRDDAEVGTNAATGQPVGDIVVYIHGFNTSQATMLERHRLVKAGLAAQGFGGAVVSFDWPSADSALNYLEDRSDAKRTARRLVDEGIKTFALMQDQGCELSVHLLAHSMGCYVVREAFDDADDRPRVAATSWSVSQVMFLSADVSASSMASDSDRSSSLYRHAVRVTNYANPYDNVLTLANVKRIGVSPRAGRIGLPELRPRKAVNVDVGPYFNGVRERYDHLTNDAHIWYFHDPKFYEDVAYTISGAIDRDSIPTRTLLNGKLYLGEVVPAVG